MASTVRATSIRTMACIMPDSSQMGVIDDIKEVQEEEGRPDGDLKTFIENNSYDLDLDEDGETVYGYDFASFDEAER